MSCLVEPAYAVARGVDELSCRLGIGAFEVGDNWKCPSCFENDSPNLPPCTDCKSSYVYEVTILKRSDSFNHRLDIRVCIAALSTASSAGLLNAGLNIWTWSPFISTLTDAIAARIPTAIPAVLQEGSRVKTYYNLTFMVSLLCSSAMLAGTLIVSVFLMAIYPSGGRNTKAARKRRTPQTWAVAVAIHITYYWVIFHSVKVEEAVLVISPIYLGSIMLPDLVCPPRKSDRDNMKKECLLNNAEEGKKN
ncbi:hypothetical protein BDZ45DRAFT_802507 [Acephala macrosclerotiorum]|nr:hypothetical protein BDZ45DRAFT_802507 [Acephala macrosclerotiorum]